MNSRLGMGEFRVGSHLLPCCVWSMWARKLHCYIFVHCSSMQWCSAKFDRENFTTSTFRHFQHFDHLIAMFRMEEAFSNYIDTNKLKNCYILESNWINNRISRDDGNGQTKEELSVFFVLCSDAQWQTNHDKMRSVQIHEETSKNDNVGEAAYVPSWKMKLSQKAPIEYSVVVVFIQLKRTRQRKWSPGPNKI